MGFFKTLFRKIAKAYQEINWLRWATLMVVFVAVELAILIPYYSTLDETGNDSSVSIESSSISISSSESETLNSSLIIVDSESSKEESSSVKESSSESSSSEEASSSVEESSSESSSSEEASSSVEESSSESSSSEEASSSVEESSSESSSSEEASSSVEESSSESSSSEEASSSVEESSNESSSSEEVSSSVEDSSSEESSSEKESDSSEDNSSAPEECEHSFTWSSSDVVWEDCETDGGIWATCKKCGKKEFTVGTPALGHNFQNGVCTRCGKIEMEDSSSSELDSNSEESSSEDSSSSELDSNSEESSSEENSSSAVDSDEDSFSSSDTSSEENSGQEEDSPIQEANQTLKFTLNGGTYTCEGVQEGVDVSTIRNIVIPDTYEGIVVSEISANAFKQNYGLLSITIGVNVEKIGDDAFLECSNLVEIYNLSSSVTIDVNDYQKNFGLESSTQIYTSLTQSSSISYLEDFIVYTSGQEKILIGYKGSETALTIPDGITTINAHAFAVNKNIESVVLSNSVKNIESSAFAKCESLKMVTIGSSVTSIGSYAFDGTALEEVVFPEGNYTWSYKWYSDIANEYVLEEVPAEDLYSDAQSAASLFLEESNFNGWGNTWTRS